MHLSKSLRKVDLQASYGVIGWSHFTARATVSPETPSSAAIAPAMEPMNPAVSRVVPQVAFGYMRHVQIRPKVLSILSAVDRPGWLGDLDQVPRGSCPKLCGKREMAHSSGGEV